MYLMIDNYDSFVYNLCCYLRENRVEANLVRSDQITMAQITPMLEAGSFQEMFLTNSLMGVMPVTALGNVQFPEKTEIPGKGIFPWVLSP